MRTILTAVRRRALCFALTLTLTLASLSPAALAQPQEQRLPAPVARALRAAAIPQSAVALWVQDARANVPRIDHNSGQPMNPASVMKLVTTYAALAILGPAYTWHTDAFATGPIGRDGTLAGDLVLRGDGDPKLTIENFWLLLNRVRARGVRDIRGDVVLDRSRFAPVGDDPGQFDGKPLRPYNVSPDALLVNFEAVRLHFTPDPSARSVTVLSEPQPSNLEIVNLLRLGQGACGDWEDAVHTDTSPIASGERLILTGVYPAACGDKERSYAPLGHKQYVAGVFRELWEGLGGTLHGTVRDGMAPQQAEPLASENSPPLADVVRDINKFSNNVMARQLLLTLGAERTTQPATPADGIAAIRDWLASKDLHFPGLVMDNGAGLSRDARISADSLGALLRDALRSPIMPEFVSSLPLAAVDGTMKKREIDEPVAGRAHIKTGTLDGVRAIAGYVLDKRDHYQIVVFLVNSPNAKAAKPAQDALLECVYRRDC